MSIYLYSLTNDFTKTHQIHESQFILEVSNNNNIVTPMEEIDVKSDQVKLKFSNDLADSELAALIIIMANHDPSVSVLSQYINSADGTSSYYTASSNGNYIFSSLSSIKLSTSTTFSNVLTLTTPYLFSGVYEIQYCFNWGYSQISSPFLAQGLLDSTITFFNFSEVPPSIFSSRSPIVSGFYVANLKAGIHTLAIQIAAGAKGQSASISNCQLRLLKVN
ncbi:MAG: hypothetical protein Solivirus3_24 [Solivirus sp.]|uniref:Uncharacterized protein n=1 Tax=Solivirus sp. TaxID=2487772 RepID=A0A3G5AHF9_9VIRU|nr:MAG: hypothetical protein Solivirus3_24 [Solivirus sp.]